MKWHVLKGFKDPQIHARLYLVVPSYDISVMYTFGYFSDSLGWCTRSLRSHYDPQTTP